MSDKYFDGEILIAPKRGLLPGGQLKGSTLGEMFIHPDLPDGWGAKDVTAITAEFGDEWLPRANDFIAALLSVLPSLRGVVYNCNGTGGLILHRQFFPDSDQLRADAAPAVGGGNGDLVQFQDVPAQRHPEVILTAVDRVLGVNWDMRSESGPYQVLAIKSANDIAGYTSLVVKADVWDQVCAPILNMFGQENLRIMTLLISGQNLVRDAFIHENPPLGSTAYPHSFWNVGDM